MMQRPDNRISTVLAQLKTLWHFYPKHTLADLIHEVTFWANLAESNLPLTTFTEIEDIAYPKQHLLYGSRNLEMGIAVLNEQNKSKPRPPVDFQLAILCEVEKRWRSNPQMRLGQLLTVSGTIAELKNAA